MSLQALIDATPEGGTLTIPPGEYPETNTLVLRRAITVIAYLVTIQAVGRGVRNRAHVRATGPDIKVLGLTIDGAGDGDLFGYRLANGIKAWFAKFVASLEAQHGFDIVGAQRCELRDCTVRNVYGDGVYVGEGPVNKTGRGAVSMVIGIYNIAISQCGRMGISVCSAADVKVSGFSIDGTGRSAIDIEPPHAVRKPTDNPAGFRTVERVLFENGSVRNYTNNLVAAGGIGHVTDVTFRNLTVDEWRCWIGERSGVVPLAPRGPWLFEDITAEHGGDGGQQAPGLQQAQMLAFNCRDVTLRRVSCGPIRQARRIAYMVRGNENTTNLRVIDCVPSPNGSGLIHPDSTGTDPALVLPELPRV